MRGARIVLTAALMAALALSGTSGALTEEPLYIVIMTHVEGDRGEPEGSPACASDLRYQTDPLPPRGVPPRGNSFAVDIVGTELLHEILQKYTDSEGKKPKLFIEPAGEFWQTEADPRFGNKLFQKYDYLALGYEFGIQGHGIYYSGQNFCWYISPKTEAGIKRKLTDLHTFAEKVFYKGQKVNAGLTLTPGAKIEGPVIGRERAEIIYDKVAYALGYRISFEDHDGHLKDEPAGINNTRSSYYLYEADYGDGVKMLKIDFNGPPTLRCPGNTARCERPEEAIARLDRTLAARREDPDPKRVYYFAFTVHSNGVWVDFHMAQAGFRMIGEGAGLVALMDAIQQRVNAGAKIKFVTPRGLKEIFENRKERFSGLLATQGGAGAPPFEDSAFGIFAGYAANEFGYFKQRAGFSNEDYWHWADEHFKKLGAHWTRSNLQLVWDIIEPVIGAGYRWDNQMLTDEIIKHIYASSNQVHWLGVFHEGGGPNPPPPGRGRLRNPLDYHNEYKAFVKAVVERYDGDGVNDAAPNVRVKYWQAGNEVFIWRDSGRTVQDYIRFARMIREAAKEADPEAKIVLIAPTNGFVVDSFLAQVIDALASEKAFDVIDVHHWGTMRDWRMTAIPQYRRLLDSKGLTHVQIWSCEHGTWQGQPTEQPVFQTEQDQARSLVKRYVYNLNNGLNKLFWNNLMEWYQFGGRSGSIFNSMGLVTDGQGPGEDPARFNTERVAYWAYKMLAEKIDTHVAKSLGRISEIFAESRLYAYVYQRHDDGRKLYILWSEIGDQQISLSVSSSRVHVTNMITDRFGRILQEQDVSAQDGRVTLTVGADPLLVEESKPATTLEQAHSASVHQLTSPTSIPIHSLVTGSSLPSIVKLTNIVVDEKRRRAYFAASLSRYIGIIDTESLEMVGVLDSRVDGFVSRFLFLNPATGILYMLIIERNQLYRIDPASGSVSAPITVRRAPAFDMTTNLVYISEPPDKIRIYSEFLQPMDVITGVTAPGELFIDPAAGKLYVVNSAPVPQAGVSVYNLSTKQLTRKYNMPTGFDGLPKGIHVGGGKIYVSGNTRKHSLSIIDEATGAGIYIPLRENGLRMETYSGRLYQMTGYPYYAGYLPNADGSYGIIEVRDAVSGSKITEIQADLESLYFDVSQSTGRLFYTATGRGIVGVIDLKNNETIKKIDVATTIEDVVVHPADGSLYLRNRLGGSTIYRVNPSAGTLMKTLIPGNWPTKILLDETRSRLYALSHYEAKISVFDIARSYLKNG